MPIRKPTVATLQRKLAEYQQQRETQERAVELADAHAAALADALRALVARIRKVGGYATTEEQLALRAAEALLVEVGR